MQVEVLDLRLLAAVLSCAEMLGGVVPLRCCNGWRASVWIKITWYVSNTVTAVLPKRSQRLFFACEQTWTPQIPLAESKFLFQTIMFNGSSLFRGFFVVLFLRSSTTLVEP